MCDTETLLASAQIIIEKSPTPVASGRNHFNMEGSPVEGRDVWDVKKLLEVKVLTYNHNKITGDLQPSGSQREAGTCPQVIESAL